MKCIFCGKDIFSTEFGFYCPDCKAYVNMQAKSLVFFPLAPKHLLNSFEYLSVLAKSHPDVAMAEAPLFSKEFDNMRTMTVFEGKKSTGSYGFRYPYCRYDAYGDIPVLSHIIASKDIVNFEFSETLAANLSAIKEYPKVPLLTLKACSADRFLWQVFIAMNTYDAVSDDIKYAVTALCASSIMDYYSEESLVVSEDAKVLSAAAHFDDRFSAVTSIDGNWLEALKKYYSTALLTNTPPNIEDGGYDRRLQSYISAMDGYKEEQRKLLNDLLEQYAEAHIVTREFGRGSNFCLLNPENSCGIETYVFDALQEKEIQKNLSTVTHRLAFYTKLYDKFLGNKNRYAETLSEAVNKICQLRSVES